MGPQNGNPTCINVQTMPLNLGIKVGVVTPFWGKYRPFVGRCCQLCTPKSWDSCFENRFSSLGFCSIIKITEKNTRYRGWLVRRLCYFIATCSWDFCTSGGDLQERIFQSKRVQDVVSPKGPPDKEDAPVGELSVVQWTRKIRQILSQIQSSLSPSLLRLCFWALLRLLNQVCFNVIIHKGQLEMVHKAAQTPGVPLVFLSAHKSHVDGLLLPLLLVSQGLGMPRVTWEYKTYTPMHRFWLTHLGGLFLPPTLEKPAGSKLGTLSRAVLASYVEELLLSRQPLLIFLEEPFCGAALRSASSQEWLGLVINALHAKQVPDVTVVPMGLSYELSPSFAPGGKGDPPRPISLWMTLWNLCRMFWGGFGSVRVDFAQPFSLQEYIANNVLRCCSPRKSLEELLLPELFGQRSGLLDCEKQDRWSPGCCSAVVLPEEQQVLVDHLSFHSLITGTSCSSVMSVTMVSALLLYSHQEGVFVTQLMQEFTWLTEEILQRNHDVGFSGHVCQVVTHALSLLRRSISFHRFSLGDVLVAPKRTEAAVRELSQHSAALLPVFIQEAVGACAIYALQVEALPYLESPNQMLEVLLVHEEVHHKALLLAHLLPREILLQKPCESVYRYCQVAVDKLIQCGVLVVEQVPGDHVVCDMAQEHFSEKILRKGLDDFGDSDSDDEEVCRRCLKVKQLENCTNFFAFLCRLLGPLLKTLERVAVFLQESEDYLPETQFMENLHRYLVMKAKEDCSSDCANWTLATIAIGIYKELGVLIEEPGPAEPVLCVSETFIAQENLERLEQFVQQFIYP